MKKNKVFFRADGNTIAGYGHVLRSLALAEILKRKYDCIFIIQNPDSFLLKQIETTCSTIITLPKSLSYSTEFNFYKDNITQDDIVVLDGYNFNTNYQNKVKKKCFKLVCIDDIFSIHFVSDVIINHSEGIVKNNYSKEMYTQVYLGIKYVILRKPFLKSTELLKKNRNNDCRVFINLGGTDQQNYTEKSLKICLENGSITQIDIVIGSYYPFKNNLIEHKKNNPNINITIHSDLSAESMSKLMKKSSFGICSASTVSYEYSNSGGILFLHKTVKNQENIYRFMINNKLAYPINSFNEIVKKAKSEKFRGNYFINKRAYFSGNSDKNLLQIFERLELERGLTIRRAKISDLKTYYSWVNENEVRKNSINSEPVSLEEHGKWFKQKYKNKNTVLYIFEKNNKALGQVRLDTNVNKVEIDYSIDKNYRGKGYGQIIILMAIKNYIEINKNSEIVAMVKAENIPSNKIFKNLGFINSRTIKKKGDAYNIYVKLGDKLNN